MSLSCSCDFDGDYGWWFDHASDYQKFDRSRRVRCGSCNELIELNSLVTKFVRWRDAQTDIEERIHGDEVPLAPKYLCERCSDLYFSLYALGFECIEPSEDMRELVKEYAMVYGGKRVEE